MGKGPSRLELIELVHEGRKGNECRLSNFADAMYGTLRRAAFDAYVALRGRANLISHGTSETLASHFLK